MRKVLVLATMMSVALALSPVRAFHEDDLPLIASAEDLGGGWASFTVTTDGSIYALDVTTDDFEGAANQVAGFFYREDDAFAGGFAFTGFAAKQGVYVDLNPPGYNVHHDMLSANAGGLFGVGFTFNDPQFGEPFVGTWKILVWYAGPSQFDWTFRGGPGTTIDGRDTGSRAYLVESRDFDSVAQVQGYAQGIGARASVGASYPLSVTDSLVGFYQSGLATAGTLSVTRPSGEQDCGLLPVVVPAVLGGICLFYALDGPDRAGPGDYSFNTMGAGAGFAGSFDDVWFGGADARLPA